MPGRGGRLAAVVATYTLVTGLMLVPVTNYAHFASAMHGSDNKLVAWTIAWVSRAMLEGHPLFAANMFYPSPNSLAYVEHHLGLSLFGLPLYAVTRNPVLVYNVLRFAAFLLSGLAAHALAFRHTRRHLAALVGGLIYAFAFPRMLHLGHLQILWSFWIPLALLALERWWRRPTWTRMAVLFACTLLQVITSAYLAVMVLLANALLLAWLVAAGQRPDASAGARVPAHRGWRTVVSQLVVAAAAGLVLVWPLEAPYRGLFADAVFFPADLQSYVVPPENTWMGQLMIRGGSTLPRWIWGEQTLYLGAVATSLALLGLVTSALPLARRRVSGREPEACCAPWAVAFFATLGLVAFALSLGPSRPPGSGWRPFDLAMIVPGLELMRAVARFSTLVVLALAVLAACGAARVLSWKPAAGRILVLALVPVMLSEWFLVRFPGGPPVPEAVPAVYRYLARVPARALVSLPMYRGTPEWYNECDYLLYSTAHWHPIVNGFGRAEPPGNGALVADMMRFPGAVSAATMRRIGVEYVVVHPARFAEVGARFPEGADARLADARKSPDFGLVGRFGPDYLFRVLPAAAIP